MVSSAAGSGSAKISGNPAFFAYSNSFLICAGLLGMVMVPPPMIVIPAASIFARSARVASGGSVRGMWTSLNVMCLTPSFLAISSAWSSVNSRIEYEATPSFRGPPLPAAGAADQRSWSTAEQGPGRGSRGRAEEAAARTISDHGNLLVESYPTCPTRLRGFDATGPTSALGSRRDK